MFPIPFAISMFLSAALLFIVEPMVGKELLPILGGTPGVWNTCLVFFQLLLLGGYLYALMLTSIRSITVQAVIYLLVVVAGLVALLLFKPDADWIPEDSDYPFIGLISYLFVRIGLPFFVLSATAPILQKWFAGTNHRFASDPYFLYAASNAGSLIGLLSYPFLIEPYLKLDDQRQYWLIGCLAFSGLTALCALLTQSNYREASQESNTPSVATRPGLLRMLKWIGLAAIPSSLLLSVTTQVSTNVAPVPLLWVVPLALYLLTFVIVFWRWTDRARILTSRVSAVLILMLMLTMVMHGMEPIGLVVALHLAAFTSVAMLCHGELARSRPDKEHLTHFYLAMSVGGVLGGGFNSLVAPLLFSNLGLVEYPLVLVVAAAIRPRRDAAGGESFRLRSVDFVLLASFTVMFLIDVHFLRSRLDNLISDFETDTLRRIVRDTAVFGIPSAAVFATVRSPSRFACCLVCFWFVAECRIEPSQDREETLLIARNFFGTLQVTKSADGKYVSLVHGTTRHGQQRLDEPGPPRPLMYFHRSGPVGRLFKKLPMERKQRVAVVGLGCGVMAAYAEPGQTWTYYEIDPNVVRIARDPKYFTFLQTCPIEPRIVLGDARRRLAAEPDHSFDLIVLDAFSSDSIPVHLMTAEAFAMYVRKLAPDGVIAFHLSNRYLELPPMVTRLGAQHVPPFRTRLDSDKVGGSVAERCSSDWVVLSRNESDLGDVARDGHWLPIDPKPGRVWRDDFSNLLDVWCNDEGNPE